MCTFFAFFLMAFEHKLPGFFVVRKNFLKIFEKQEQFGGAKLVRVIEGKICRAAV